MAYQFADRVQEITTTTGTGSITLGGAVLGFRTFASAITVGNTVPYSLFDPSTNAWEVGYGTLSASTTLARTTVLASSASNAAISLSGNTAYVFLTLPAEFLGSGTGASGTWGISISGNAATTSQTAFSTLTVSGALNVDTLQNGASLQLGTHGKLWDDGNFHIEAPSGTLWIDSVGSGVYLNNQNNGDVVLTNGTGAVRVLGNQYVSGILYDNQNTNYYLKPSGTTTLNTLNTGIQTISGSGNIITASDGTHSYAVFLGTSSSGANVQFGSASNDNFGIFTNNGVPTFIVNTDTGITVSGIGRFNNGRSVLRDNSLENWSDNATGTVAISYNGYQGGTTQYRDLYVYDGKGGQLFGCLSAGSGGYNISNNALRAPSFVDMNNTAYYITPSGTSNLLALNVNGAGVLTTSNFNSYSPTLTGTGASGTWNIAISGNAATATTANALNTANSYQGVNITSTGRIFLADGSATAPSLTFTNEPVQDTGIYWSADGFMNFTNNGVYSGQTGPGGSLSMVGTITAASFSGAGTGLTGTAASLDIGGNSATTSQTNFSNLTIGGNQVLDAANFNSYAPTLTGTGASGTWNIAISGNAATVSAITSAQITSALGFTPAASGAIRTVNRIDYGGSGTYTPSAGMIYCLVHVEGGGGGGGYNSGGAGGAGGNADALFTAAQIGSGVSFTIGGGGAGSSNGVGGTGGTSTFGSFVTCYGGTGGSAVAGRGGNGGGASVSSGVVAYARPGQGGGSGVNNGHGGNGGGHCGGASGVGGSFGSGGGGGNGGGGAGASGGGGVINIIEYCA
jgi:hypothetical protein